MQDRRARIDAEKLLAEARWASHLARSLVRDDAAAQDVVQSALVAALESAPGVEGRLRPWLARVVRNFAAQSRRSEAHRSEREQVSARAERSPSAAETAERLESQRVLVEALEALEEPYRTTVTLRYLEGLSAAQIARRERIPAGTVRWRLKEGLDRLRARLDKRFQGGRGSWALALLPILKRPPLGAAAAASASGVLEGVLLMNTMLKVGIAAAVLVAAMIGIRFAVDHGGSGRASTVQTTKDEHAPALDASDVDHRNALADAPSTSARATAAVALASAPTSDQAAAEPPTRLHARCVDPAGSPLNGAKVVVQGSSALSSNDGTVTMDVAPSDDVERTPLVVSLAGRATRFDTAQIERGKTAELGDLVLQPGGSVAGIVVGPDGQPVAGAKVLVSEPELGERLDLLRRKGPFLSDSAPPVPTAVTGADGAFLVDGVPARTVRVWAGSDATRYACTDPIEIAAGEARTGIRLALEPLAADDVIEGVVLDPDGAPVYFANVLASWKGKFSSGSDGVATDANGRFRIRLREKVTLDMKLRDPMRRWADVVRPGVRPGEPGVVLQFVRGREFDLIVSDEKGAVTTFSTLFRSADGRGVLSNSGPQDHEGGRVRLRVQAEAFLVEILAPGHARGRVGPVDPANVPASIDCKLERIPGVRGRVLAHGRPLPGATVRVHALAPGDRSVISNGFSTRLDPRVVDSAHTDEQGRFDLTVRDAGTYALVAESEGLATTELSPIELVPQKGAEGLEVSMSEGGSIEGHVLVPSGRNPAGTIVGVSRGDGTPRTVRADANGGYRFDRLMPGRWLVVRAQGEVSAGNQTTNFIAKDQASEPGWSCSVSEGEVTRYDLDLRSELPCGLVAKVAFGDRPTQGWIFSVQSTSHLHLNGVGLDSEGHARAEVERPGTYAAILRMAGEGYETGFSRLVTLAPGDDTWNLAVRAGVLEGRVGGATRDAPAYVLYQAALPGGDFFEARATTGADGRYRLPFVPEGKGTLRHLEGEGTSESTPISSRDVEPKAGETTTVDLD
jgi:RNA polymerase sigma-70 factor (ECF subfamily)